MPINLASYIQPRNGNSYFLLEDVYLKGGFQVRADAVERDAINSLNRKHGMLVFTKSDGKLWSLNSDLQTWSEFTAGAGGAPVERKQATYTTPVLDIDAWHDFSLVMGKTVTVLSLSVDQPCTVEVYTTSARLDTNPYKFVAVADHLTDDGSTMLSDGSVLYGRRFSILSNLEEPSSENIYFRIFNSGSTPGSITLNVSFIPME